METTKTAYAKPILTSLGSLEHINQRISTLQKRLALAQVKIKELNQEDEKTPAQEASLIEAIEAQFVYSNELNRLQDKYSLILSLNSYGN